MVDPVSSANRYGAYRSDNRLVFADTSATTTPSITFSNSGVTLVDGSGNESPSLTTVVKDAGVDLRMAYTTNQSTDIEAAHIATKRLTAVIKVDANAPAGPVTMTITNPDGGKVVYPSAFIVDGSPTIDVVRNLEISAIEQVSDASIKQGEVKKAGTAIYIYGSGFFGAPQVSVSGSGVRVTSVQLGKLDPTSSPTILAVTDSNQNDTVLRVEVSAESTAPISTRDVTVVLPDGQSVTAKAALSVGAP